MLDEIENKAILSKRLPECLAIFYECQADEQHMPVKNYFYKFFEGKYEKCAWNNGRNGSAGYAAVL